MAKPKVGIFSLTSCDGCQVVILESFNQLVQLQKYIDIASFELAKEINDEGPFDISIVEGSIVNTDDIKKIKEIRKKSKVLIAIGTCATHGGVQAAKNFMNQKKVTHAVYPPGFIKNSTEVTGIGSHVKVDYLLWGCPPDANDVMRLIRNIIAGQKPKNYDEDPLCLECRALGHECILQKGQLCLGPITHKGCNAVCISAGEPCLGCRGFLNTANIDELIKQLKVMDYTDKQIKDAMSIYMSNSKRVRKVIENGEDN